MVCSVASGRKFDKTIDKTLQNNANYIICGVSQKHGPEDSWDSLSFVWIFQKVSPWSKETPHLHCLYRLTLFHGHSCTRPLSKTCFVWPNRSRRTPHKKKHRFSGPSRSNSKEVFSSLTGCSPKADVEVHRYRWSAAFWLHGPSTPWDPHQGRVEIWSVGLLRLRFLCVSEACQYWCAKESDVFFSVWEIVVTWKSQYLRPVGYQLLRLEQTSQVYFKTLGKGEVTFLVLRTFHLFSCSLKQMKRPKASSHTLIT